MFRAGHFFSCRWVLVVCLQLGAWGGAEAVPGTARGQSVPVLSRIRPTESSAAVSTLRVGPDLEVRLVAAEPRVCDPVALDFDEWGRAYVVEMRGYSESGAARLGRVRRLSDKDGDGLFESSEVLVDGLQNPTAIACAHGGVIVGDAPDLLFFADRDGDGVSDERHVLFTGFGVTNIQQLLNNLGWGPDGRLYGSSGGNGGEIRRGEQAWPFPAGTVVAAEQQPINLRGRDFVIDLRSGMMNATTGGGQFGQTIDCWGNRYVCSNSDHCQQIVLDDRYLARNPLLRSGASRVNIAREGPAATIYRSSPVEAWRMARTELRIQGKAKGPIEGGGRASGYFSGATGICYYDGVALADAYRGNLFVADAGSNLVHRKQLLDQGVVKSAARIEQDREFLASTDNWFRPVQLVNAPDGALWVLDMYREVVEHPASLPESIKRQLDLSSGNDRGRLYRITSRGISVESGPLPGNAASPEELAAFLGHANGWHRRTAARLLRERPGEATTTAVRDWLAALSEEERSSGISPKQAGRVLALYMLRDWGALTIDELMTSLRAREPELRALGLRLAEGNDDARLQAERCRLATDPDESVRFQAALALGEFPDQPACAALAAAARLAGANDWLRTAVLCSAATRRAELLEAYLARSAEQLSPAELEFVTELARQIGQASVEAEKIRLARAISEWLNSRPGVAIACWFAATGGDRASVRQFDHWAQAAEKGVTATDLSGQLLAQARRVALDQARPVAERGFAVKVLELLPREQLLLLWRELIDLSQPEAVRISAIELCHRAAVPEIFDLLVACLSELTPELRSRALEGLLARPQGAAWLLSALESGEVPMVFLTLSQRQQLLGRPEVELRQRAEKLLGGGSAPKTEEQLTAFRGSLEGLTGEPEAGRAVFRRVCASCHLLAGEGAEVGPNLIGYAFRSRDDLLLQVLDPNREVDPRYLSYSVELRDGRLLLGVLAGENAAAIILKTAAGESVTLNRDEVEAIRSTSKSLMPENLVNELTPQQFADLSAWLQGLRE